MKKTLLSPDDLRGVFAVPPLARMPDAKRSIDAVQNELIVKHIQDGGITRLIYGGNAFLYHISLSEFAYLLDWLSGLPDDLWLIPSIGPTYGRAMDQAPLLRRWQFPCVMILPCSDPRDAKGLDQGYREIAAEAETRLIVYIKDENNFGVDRNAGLDAVARLVDDGLCLAIKYAVVRENPSDDAYLDALLRRVDPQHVISGIGERPAIAHLQQWKLPGFTTGSGCIAPRLSQNLFSQCADENWESAERLRQQFLPHEDMRDKWGPARVLHHATELAGIARSGAMLPYVTPLEAYQLEQLAPVARELLKRNANQSGAGSR